MANNEHVDRQNEPVLEVKNIQGNIIPGFNKDYQSLLFLKIESGNEDKFRSWLKEMVPYITTMEQVLGFRSLLEEEKAGKRPEDPPKRKAIWRNIAFSHSALKNLNAVEPGNDFRDPAFREGLTESRANKVLGDPEGDTKNWKVGGPRTKADVILIVACDCDSDRHKEVERIKNNKNLSELLKANEEKSGLNGLHVLHGTNLPHGHEHFGFRDGVSQPGLRAQVPNTSPDYVTRGYKSQNKLGQDRIWLGEFVFGHKYPRQGPKDKEAEGSRNSLKYDPYNVEYDPYDVEKGVPDESSPAAPTWAEDGSFLVFRRLRQYVGAFRKSLDENKLGMDPNRLGAKCVGRWESGVPILLAPERDNPEFEDDKKNDFKFGKFRVGKRDGEDLKGEVCPFASHIRKMYPRDDVDESEVQTHRLLRRGISYGEEFKQSPTDEEDRGLLFLAYQTSIVNQFEFLQKQAINPNLMKDKAGYDPGYDPIIGQNKESPTRTFNFEENGERKSLTLSPPSWVTPTGGGYFFAPSIDALQMLADPSEEKRISYFSASSPEALNTVLQNTKTVQSSGTQPKAITPAQWAQIWAHAWLKDDPNLDFEELLKTNPKKAVEEFVKMLKEGSIPAPPPPFEIPDRIFDMELLYKEALTTDKSFEKLSNDELATIISDATLNGGKFCVQINEFKKK